MTKHKFKVVVEIDVEAHEDIGYDEVHDALSIDLERIFTDTGYTWYIDDAVSEE